MSHSQLQAESRCYLKFNEGQTETRNHSQLQAGYQLQAESPSQ